MRSACLVRTRFILNNFFSVIGLGGGPRTPLGYAPGYFATYTAWYHDITLYTIGAYHTRYYFNVRSKADRIYRTELITKVGKEKN